WLSLAMGSLAHLDGRLTAYEQVDEGWMREFLAPRVREAALALGGMIQEGIVETRAAWGEAGLRWPEGGPPGEPADPPASPLHLPRDLIEERESDSDLATEGQAPPAARLAARYLSILESLERGGVRRLTELADLRQFMANRCTEENARTFEARIHNLQSTYDSQVAGTAQEKEYPELRAFRGTISQALHLFEAVTALAHLYERHDIYERRGSTRAIFERLVEERRLLEITVNTCVVGAYESLRKGAGVARGLVRQLTQHASIDLELSEGLQLHARPISMIVSVVNHHGTPVTMEINGQRCSAASIMQMLVLAGSNLRARRIRFSGDQTPLRDLALLFEHRLGEDGADDFPDQLAYLRP
ncbi:MAG: HPr family phosphocarrier protein, partial [Planctomycetota bacterium]